MFLAHTGCLVVAWIGVVNRPWFACTVFSHAFQMDTEIHTCPMRPEDSPRLGSPDSRAGFASWREGNSYLGVFRILKDEK